MFVPITGAQLFLSVGETRGPQTLEDREAHFLAPAFVSSWREHIETDPTFGPIYRGAHSTLGVGRVEESAWSLMVGLDTLADRA